MRPKVDLSPCKDLIVESYKQGSTSAQIAEMLTYRGVKTSERTVKARLAEWGVTKRKGAKETPELRVRIADLFYNVGLQDGDMLQVLKADGYKIEKRRLARIRKVMGLRRTISAMDIMALEEDQHKLEAIIKQELDNGVIESNGRNHLSCHFSSLKVKVSPDRPFRVIKKHPPGVPRRLKRNLKVHRSKFVSPGPNFCWSIDAYCKLDHWGFEIYAAVDNYSRFVPWFYCGTSSHAPVGVMGQYISIVEDKGFAPLILRSDRGAETELVADCHYRLRQKISPDANIPFSQCYRYGTSKKNQRVESWWRQMSLSALLRWREFFQELEQEGEWDREDLGCRIALLAIYMPVLRKSLTCWVSQWNRHRIRPQNNRPHVVPGQPWKLYHYPPQAVDDYRQRVKPEFLEDFRHDLNSMDIDEYLPSTTLAWCTARLGELGYPNGIVAANSSTPRTGERPHKHAYIQLKELIQTHLRQGNEQPVLAICKEPTGTRAWQPAPEVIAGQSDYMEVLGDDEDQPADCGSEGEMEDYIADIWIAVNAAGD